MPTNIYIHHQEAWNLFIGLPSSHAFLPSSLHPLPKGYWQCFGMPPMRLASLAHCPKYPSNQKKIFKFISLNKSNYL
jgi:hypothetical protein